MKRARIVYMSGVGLIAIAACDATHAQSAVPNGASAVVTPAPTMENVGGTELREIVVTGRKRFRSEEIQKTPVSITAFDKVSLQQPVIVTLTDIGKQSPNASLAPSSQKGIQNFEIRGMGISGSTVSDEPAVGIFQDGVYWGSNYGALGELFDLEDVEILRGPQGTLFGRNVTGGAVTIRSARPTNTESERITLGLGNGQYMEASAVVNLPIVRDKLAGRLAVQAENLGGYYRNTVEDGRWGRLNSYIIRPSLKWTPTPDLDITALGEYDSQHGDPAVVRGLAPNNVPGGPITLAEIEGYRTPKYYWGVSPDTPGFSRVDVRFGVLEANWHIGPGTLTSVTGYRSVRTRVLTDFDGSPSKGFLQGISYNQHQISSELRYAAEISKFLSFTTGLYYFDQKLNSAESRSLNQYSSNIAARSLLNNESYAAFAEGDIHISSALTATVGGRYTHETKDARTAPFGSCGFPFGVCTFGNEGHYGASNFSPKFGLSYQIDRNKLVYASYTRGFRSGGFSLRGTVLAEPYRAEKVQAYEVGFKTDFFHHRFRFNAAGFYNKYTDLQRTVLGVSPTQGVIQSTFNASNANIRGAEVELTAIVVPGVTLSGNYGYTDARYVSFQGFDNPSALQFVRVPKNTFNVTARFEHKFENGHTASLEIVDSYTGGFYFDDKNTLRQSAYNLVNGTISYDLSKSFAVSIYGKNLTKTKYANWGSSNGALGENLYIADPRTYGIRVTANF